ncbi:Septin ring organizing protein mid2 [Grifola frondosa]|uniref:Septin ring organizing protein mid2 n=1 Tax=Grifola frondosa TaxID=5627 RepID=A0A1C7LZ39_GRIFR|nr:Septin ring organizing protein mid2 [Grifola frondosa]
MSSGLPLRDRLQSNSPEPAEDGWLSQTTTPLRIAKRDSPQPQRESQLARRQSSSYKHVKDHQLVTKSPFRSLIPTPSPRRVSCEKRPRPISLQVENEHPLGFKRRQSKGFQGLLQKEPVSQSPFKKAPNLLALDDVPPLPPPKVAGVSSHRVPSSSLLVTKRLHGPRDVGRVPSSSRRARRKTVTFDERCDVVEFDVDDIELDEDTFLSDIDQDYDDVDADAINGLVDSMLGGNSNQGALFKVDNPDFSSTRSSPQAGDPRHNDEDVQQRPITLTSLEAAAADRTDSDEFSCLFSSTVDERRTNRDKNLTTSNMDSEDISLPNSCANGLFPDPLSVVPASSVEPPARACSVFAANERSNIPGPDKNVVDTGCSNELLVDGDVTCEMILPPMTRENNATYDGILSIDPEPQLIDPPRPSMPPRAHTLDEIDARRAFEGLELDFGRGFAMGDEGMSMSAGLGLAIHGSDMHLGDVSALDKLVEDVAQGVDKSGITVEAVTEGIKASRFEIPITVEEDDFMDTKDDFSATHQLSQTPPRPGLEDATVSLFNVPQIARSSPPPPPPPKDAIRAREELIKAKKREARRHAEGQFDGSLRGRDTERPSRRRSRSTGDARLAQQPRPTLNARMTMDDGGLLGTGPVTEDDDPLAVSINRELRKLENTTRSNYHVREREETIYATFDTDGRSHMASAGDEDGGMAWKTNEYSKQIKDLRAQEKLGKTHGKVFVKVIGLKGLGVPLPHQPTTIVCTLNNGIHFVTTPESRLDKDCRIDQEFELIEHSKLEFTLTIKVTRHPHIKAQFNANDLATRRPTPQPALPPASKGGVRAFFRGSSPKKSNKAPSRQASPVPAPHLEENLARYLKPDGTLARAFISFKDIAKRCDTKLFETSYPLISQKNELNAPSKTLQVGEIVLQIFRLPALQGIPSDKLPQSLEECHRGLRHVSWHKQSYLEGTLTQSGGDCTSWRRRQLRIVGASLIAFNDVTKRAIATIDLRKAVAVEDDRETVLSPASGSTTRSMFTDDFDGPYGVERSFRLVFATDQAITFFADTDEEKDRWLQVLRALVGRIPPNPLWAELVWQRQQEQAKQGMLQGHLSERLPSHT